AELGAALFTRTTRQVRLTPAGEFLREEARRVLGSVDDSVRGVRRIAQGRLGLVRMAFTGTAAFTHLPRIVRAVKRELPDVALEVHADLLTPAQCDGLRDGSLDLGLLRPPATGEEISVRTIEVEPLVLTVPADHRLADEPAVAMTDLATESFVLYSSPDSAVNEAVVRSCRQAGFLPHHEHDAPGTAVLLALVAAGLGVALVPSSARAMPLAGVTFRDVAGAGSVELALAWREHRESALVTSVLDVLEDLFTAERPRPAQKATR
ncbi:LysR family transcriptional regulator, partial [Lentzea sp.]|uniref:LysR family transcriptional regulator n=1 Tax=Lentzea sp. TaxID=56099 RepID=UPI002ED1C340